MTILIRKAEPNDLPALLRLLEALFGIETDFAFDPAKQAAGLGLLLTSDGARVLVAEHDGAVVGMGSIQIVVSTAEGGPVGWVEDLVVAADHRGRGIGRRLLEHLEAWAVERGLSRLQLLADRHNSDALGFYQRLGWQRTALLALRKFPAQDRR